MLVFSRSIGERTGNLEVNRAQFRELEMARNMSAQAVADFIARARFGENGHWTQSTPSTTSAACIALMIRLCWRSSNRTLSSPCLTT